MSSLPKMPKNTNRNNAAKAVPSETPKVAAHITISDKATKRVIAPFVRIIRKDQKLQEVEETKHFTLFLQRKPSVLLRDLSTFLSDSVDLSVTLHDTADVLQNVTKAAGVTLYLMDPSTNEIYQSNKTPIDDRHKIRWKLKPPTTIATYVACYKEYVMVEDLVEDERFPDGIGYESDRVKSVLCVPVVTPDGECFAVVELYKLLFDHPFEKDDLKITLIVTGWMGTAVHQNFRRLALKRQQELNDYLLDLTKCYFGESVSSEKMIFEIVKFARCTLNAERASMFVIDQESGDDMIADVFDDDDDRDGNYKRPQKVRFTKDRGIPSLVAKTGVTVNVKDAYNDPRFNKDIEQKSNFITRSILCMPIEGCNGILGVIQVINKRSGSFSQNDEMLFKTFCSYSSLALIFGKAQNTLNTTKHMNFCFKKMLNLQMKPCIHDFNNFSQNRHIPIPLGFGEISWYIPDNDYQYLPQYCLHLFQQVIKAEEIDVEKLMNFILTVQKFYRRVPYHNFELAFNSCHAMHNLLRKNPNKFTSVEQKALMIASLCINLDHPGYTNSFLQLIKDDLSYVYKDSILEHHHYKLAILIFEAQYFFKNLSQEDDKLLKEEIKNAILFTDLSTYLIHKIEMDEIVETKSFDWKNTHHRFLLKGLMMVACDLSWAAKPFLVSKGLADNLYAENYEQGDMEKKMGLCPLTSMDRDKAHMIPEDQVKFITDMLLPCLALLKEFLPNAINFFIQARFSRETWQDIIDVRDKKCWRQDDSLVSEKSHNY